MTWKHTWGGQKASRWHTVCHKRGATWDSDELAQLSHIKTPRKHHRGREEGSLHDHPTRDASKDLGFEVMPFRAICLLGCAHDCTKTTIDSSQDWVERCNVGQDQAFFFHFFFFSFFWNRNFKDFVLLLSKLLWSCIQCLALVEVHCGHSLGLRIFHFCEIPSPLRGKRCLLCRQGRSKENQTWSSAAV